MDEKEVITKNNAETEENCSIVQNNDGSSEEELKKILQMRDLVEKQDLTSQMVSSCCDLDVDKACVMFLKYLKWRKIFVPNGLISESKISTNIAENKFFMQGTDKSGRLITVVFGGKHYPNKGGGVEEFKRFVVFVFERILLRTPAGQEKFVVIADIQGWGYSNSDIRGYLATISILQDYYPEQLGKMYFVNVPYLFMAAWKIIYPFILFIDEKTNKKIVFVEKKHLNSTFMKDIDESQLPEIYGGKLKLDPIQDSQFSNS